MASAGTVPCGHCNKPMEVDAAHCLIMRFKYQPWLDHLHFQCECGGICRYWVPENNMAEAEAVECAVMEADFGDDELTASFFEMHGIEYPPKTYELPPTLSKECDNFAAVLRTIPDDLLLDALKPPAPPSNLPERWT